MSTMQAEVGQLLEREIPESRRHLRDSHANLERVASYCEGNYLQANDRRHALEETKNYTTQSLASVAYQINTLANNFIMLLDLQLNQLADMESSINHLSQTVMIHKEKVARREIGVLTTNKATARPAGVKNPGIIFPDQQEKPVKYMRKSIDYSILDDIGHGVKTQQQNPRTRRTSTGSTKSASQAPTTKPPTPPSGTYRMPGSGTLTRQGSSSQYRAIAPPVTPPSVPSNYAASGYPHGVHHGQVPAPIQIQAGSAERRSGYAAVNNKAQAPPATPPPPPPPMGMVQPMPHQMPHAIAGVMSQGAPPTPPPPPMPAGPMRQSFNEPLPPPLPESAYQMPMGNVSPPLPPPPDQDPGYADQFNAPPAAFSSGPHDVDYGMGRFGGPLHPTARVEESVVPDTYIEKVVAIYDYIKDKDDELSFSEGAVIYVIRKNDDGWWEGMLDGTTGLFPGNYVEPCI